MAAAPDNVLGHWAKLCLGLQESPKEFYARVEAAVLKLQIPETKMERLEYREGGAFSGFREYLRIRRRREVFDVCGAPFGDGFFFSWWLAEARPSLPGIATILIIFLYLGILGMAANKYGAFMGPIAVLLFVPIALAVVHRLGKPEFDDFILMLPLIGPLYDRFFAPITYYRIDTSQMFQQAIEAAVMEAVDQVTAGKGIKALSELERKPVMRDFFKR